MTPKDIATHLTTIVFAIIAALFVFFAKMPWYIGMIIVGAVLAPSSAPAIAAALANYTGGKTGPGLVLVAIVALGRFAMMVVAGVFLAVVLDACSAAQKQAREDAIKNYAEDKALCAADRLGEPIEDIVKECAENVTGDDLTNFRKLVFGMKAGAAKAGAKIPDAPDGGAR